MNEITQHKRTQWCCALRFACALLVISGTIGCSNRADKKPESSDGSPNVDPNVAKDDSEGNSLQGSNGRLSQRFDIEQLDSINSNQRPQPSPSESDPNEFLRQPANETPAQSPPPPQPIVFPARKWVNEADLPQEDWYIQYLSGRRIGYFRRRISKGSTLISIERDAFFELVRDGELSTYQISLSSMEMPDGSLLSFQYSSDDGSTETRVSGQLNSGRLSVRASSSDPSETPASTTLDWQPGTWGVLDIQAIFMAKPMQPGELRTADTFVPRLRKVLPMQIAAGQPEITAIPGGGAPELLPINVAMLDGNDVLRSRHWVDERGQILKSITLDGTMISTFRAPPELASRVEDEFKLKGMLSRRVPLKGKRPPGDALAATFEVDSFDSDLYSLWARNVRQTVQSISAVKSTVTVRRVTNTSDIAGLTIEKPTNADLAESVLIQSQHSLIEAMANELVGQAAEPKAIITRLAQGVVDNVELLKFAGKPISAAEVARDRQGDSTAHAMLLVALLRNQGIPARVASGLHIDRSGKRFEFHMWTEAWLEDRWLSIDATTGYVASLDCLKILDSSLESSNAYAAITPVFDALGTFSISVSDVKTNDEAVEQPSNP